MKQLLIAIGVMLAAGNVHAQVTHPQSSTTQPPHGRSNTNAADTMRSKRTNRNATHNRTNRSKKTGTTDTARYRNTNDNSRYNGNNR